MSLPPAQPAYILRGHAAQIHSTTFIRANSRLVTGDADGWIVLWSLATKRPAAVWRAHEGAILGSAEWGRNAVITHGKDDKLIVWKLTEQDEANLSVALPVDDPGSHRMQPWVLHVLHVNTLNFCSFAHCESQGQIEQSDGKELATTKEASELLIALPNTISSESVDIFHLPSERRLHTVSGDKTVKTGMVMAVSISYSGADLTVITGFESGHTTVSQLIDGQGWHILYMSQPHSQPILSLAVNPNRVSYLTSSADAIVAKHPIPSLSPEESGSGIMNPLSGGEEPKILTSGMSFLSQGLASTGPQKNRPTYPPKTDRQTIPLKIVQTKHSGQQGLKIRSDGKIFATAGWDSRVRVYSAQSLKELAVLKWHKEGCYAVAFATIIGSNDDLGRAGKTKTTDEERAMTTTTGAILSVKEQRDLRATTTHWLAAGSKDGKVSLWDIY